jgi:hypothetical protein
MKTMQDEEMRVACQTPPLSPPQSVLQHTYILLKLVSWG